MNKNNEIVLICIDNKASYYNAPVHRTLNCTDTCCIYDLTPGKNYIHKPFDNEPIGGGGQSGHDGAVKMYYRVIDDMGEEHNYYKNLFMTVKEKRENQIEEILNN